MNIGGTLKHKIARLQKKKLKKEFSGGAGCNLNNCNLRYFLNFILF